MIFDLAVIGGGPAGYTAALEAVKEGLKVILFEKNYLGGTCLNCGCVPTNIYYIVLKYIRHLMIYHFMEFLLKKEKLITKKQYRTKMRLLGSYVKIWNIY